LRFVPDGDFSGTAELTEIRAWDQESGTSGDTIPEIDVAAPSTTYSEDSTSATITVDDAPEVDTIERVDGASNPTNADELDFDVSFTDEVSDVAADDFTATQVSGDATGQVSAVSESGGAYTVTVDGVDGDGDLRLDLVDDDGITSGGVPLGGDGTGGSADGSADGDESFTVDNTRPDIDNVAITDAPGYRQRRYHRRARRQRHPRRRRQTDDRSRGHR
jgi:hypothetical protein